MNKVTEDVIVKDFGKQGLELFVPADPATYGRIAGFLTHNTNAPGYRPDVEETKNAIYGFEEASMGYYHAGKKPKADDPRDQPCELTLRRVFRDQQRYRIERWKR